jgi:hypothetical protein
MVAENLSSFGNALVKKLIAEIRFYFNCGRLAASPRTAAGGQTRTSTVSTYCKIKGHPEAASQLQSGVSD